jgi:hypothetical protein
LEVLMGRLPKLKEAKTCHNCLCAWHRPYMYYQMHSVGGTSLEKKIIGDCDQVYWDQHSSQQNIVVFMNESHIEIHE